MNIFKNNLYPFLKHFKGKHCTITENEFQRTTTPSKYVQNVYTFFSSSNLNIFYFFHGYKNGTIGCRMESSTLKKKLFAKKMEKKILEFFFNFFADISFSKINKGLSFFDPPKIW